MRITLPPKLNYCYIFNDYRYEEPKDLSPLISFGKARVIEYFHYVYKGNSLKLDNLNKFNFDIPELKCKIKIPSDVNALKEALYLYGACYASKDKNSIAIIGYDDEYNNTVQIRAGRFQEEENIGSFFCISRKMFSLRDKDAHYNFYSMPYRNIEYLQNITTYAPIVKSV